MQAAQLPLPPMWEDFIHYRLARDRVEVKNIDALHTTFFNRLIQEVIENPTVQEQMTELRISRTPDPTLRVRTPEQMGHMFRSIQSLSAIKDLELLYFTDEAFPDLLNFLRNHQSLESFHFVAAYQRAFRADMASELALALSTISTLREVEVCATVCQHLPTLLNSSYNLQCLAIRDAVVGAMLVDRPQIPTRFDSALSNIFQSIHHHSRLRELTIEVPLGHQVTLAVYDMIRHNTSLVKLDFGIMHTVTPAIIALAEALTVNSTLQEVYISLEAGQMTLSPDAKGAVMTMLSRNYTLRKFRLVQVEQDEDIHHAEDYYMKLNCIGRGRLFSSGSKRDWVEMLVQNSQDLDCLFYFIGANPSLCNQQEQQTSRDEEDASLQEGGLEASSSNTTGLLLGDIEKQFTFLQQNYDQLDRRNCDLNRRNAELQQQLQECQEQMQELQILANRAIELSRQQQEEEEEQSERRTTRSGSKRKKRR